MWPRTAAAPNRDGLQLKSYSLSFKDPVKEKTECKHLYFFAGGGVNILDILS